MIRTLNLLLGSMRYVSGLMRSMVTPRSGSVRSSCLCCFSRDVALYCTNLPKNKGKAKPMVIVMYCTDAKVGNLPVLIKWVCDEFGIKRDVWQAVAVLHSTDHS